MSETIALSAMSVHRSRPDPARGVFETLLVREGRPLELEAHLARLGSSVETLYAQPLPAVRDAVLDHARGVPLGRLRLTASPRDGGLATAIVVAPVVPAFVFPVAGVELSPLVVEGGIGPHKWVDRRLLTQAEDGRALPLVVDEDGSVLEASRANVFVVEGGSVVTPPADGRLLPGVTRARVVGLAGVREEPIDLARLHAADEVFLTGSVRGVEPVAGRDGPVTGLVAGQLRRHWEENP